MFIIHIYSLYCEFLINILCPFFSIVSSFLKKLCSLYVQILIFIRCFANMALCCMSFDLIGILRFFCCFPFCHLEHLKCPESYLAGFFIVSSQVQEGLSYVKIIVSLSFLQ